MSVTVEVGQEPQSAGAVLMVRPRCFGFNPQTAASNSFQRAPGSPDVAEAGVDWGGVDQGRIDAGRIDRGDRGQQTQALREFDGLADALQRVGVEVLVAEDTESPFKPDAIFPNNWVSFHRDGTVALYPMMAVNRRAERREEVLERVVREGSFHISRTVDLTHREAQDKFLEGTGSVVLDRTHRTAYASPSPRTDLDVLGEFAQQLDYELVTFDAIDAAGQPVYHTNVAMAIGSRFAVVCGEAIAQAAHRGAVFSKLRASGHDVIDISLGQMLQFAGNVLELAAPGGAVIALSSAAWSCLEPQQRRVVESYAGVVPVPIPTIERIGGGGVRCMLAEIHLPKRDRSM